MFELSVKSKPKISPNSKRGEEICCKNYKRGWLSESELASSHHFPTLGLSTLSTSRTLIWFHLDSSMRGVLWTMSKSCVHSMILAEASHWQPAIGDELSIRLQPLASVTSGQTFIRQEAYYAVLLEAP